MLCFYFAVRELFSKEDILLTNYAADCSTVGRRPLMLVGVSTHENKAAPLIPQVLNIHIVIPLF